VDIAVDSLVLWPRQALATCTDVIHRLCMTEIWSHFGPGFSTGKYTGRIALPVEKGCAQATAAEFSPAPERLRLTVHRHVEITAVGRRKAAVTLRTGRTRHVGRLSFACVFEHPGCHRPHRGSN
jgi:hypothetical protein